MHRQRWTADSGHELPSGLDLRNDRDVSIVTVEWRFPLLEVDRQCRGSVGLSQFDPLWKFCIWIERRKDRDARLPVIGHVVTTLAICVAQIPLINPGSGVALGWRHR